MSCAENMINQKFCIFLCKEYQMERKFTMNKVLLVIHASIKLSIKEYCIMLNCLRGDSLVKFLVS